MIAKTAMEFHMEWFDINTEQEAENMVRAMGHFHDWYVAGFLYDPLARSTENNLSLCHFKADTDRLYLTLRYDSPTDVGLWPEVKFEFDDIRTMTYSNYGDPDPFYELQLAKTWRGWILCDGDCPLTDEEKEHPERIASNFVVLCEAVRFCPVLIPDWFDEVGFDAIDTYENNDHMQAMTCPECGSNDVAEILWGMPAFDDNLREMLDSGRVYLGGCCITPESAEYHCNACGSEFGQIELPIFHEDTRLKSIVFGAAVGDAMGVPFEFKMRGTFYCTHPVGEGTYNMPAGTFSDDTSLLIATCDSIRACDGKIDIDDMRARFLEWLRGGKYTADGNVFDVGNATATTLESGKGCDGERSNGNGSLMRIAPLALTDADDKAIAAVSAITHAHPISTTACIVFVGILRDVLSGRSLAVAIEDNIPEDDEFSFLRDVASKSRDEIPSSGFVLDTLEAALWCNLHSGSYAECVQEAVNLGEDTDTTACVAGALAGAIYGFRSIPENWLNILRGKKVIEKCLF